ncbi:hypothetical protein B0H13DRAFT_2055633 [Mycena leptocephala]|nr:hypothetical protein B0H13DRAFT_2055633 [Mycena leptocephala]
MRANSFFAAVFSILLAGTSALSISTPLFLTAGPARINFTKSDGDPAGAYFNIAVASNASRLADNVDLSAGFVDVNILVLPGTYEIFAFNNDTDSVGPGFLGAPTIFPASSPPSSSVSPTSSAAPQSTSSATSSGTAVAAESSLSLNGLTTKTSSKSLPMGMIIGIVMAVLAIIAILIILFFLLRRRKRRTRRASADTGDMLETPGPMVWSSPSHTTQIDPFVTPLSSETSLSSPLQRQQYITNEMRLVRKQMEELSRSGNGTSISASSALPESSVYSPSQASTHDTSALDLEQSRQMNDTLQSRIVQLEEQLQSAWALGLSNEPPPGYVA